LIAATDEVRLVRVAVSNDRITDDPSEHARLVPWSVLASLVTGSANEKISARENIGTVASDKRFTTVASGKRFTGPP
jgi:hypothetical protein